MHANADTTSLLVEYVDGSVDVYSEGFFHIVVARFIRHNAYPLEGDSGVFLSLEEQLWDPYCISAPFFADNNGHI